MNTNQYLGIFIEEATENLQKLNQSLLQLEANKEDTLLLNRIFRITHTLKGMAATMGFGKMSGLTHAMEDVLHKVKNGALAVDEILVNLLFQFLDALEDYLKNIVNSGEEGLNEYNGLLQALRNIDVETAQEKADRGNEEPDPSKKIMQMDIYVKSAIKKSHEMGMNVYKITVTLDKGCILKAARAFVIFKALEAYSDIIKSEPGVQDIEDEKFDFAFSLIAVTRKGKDDIIKDLYGIAEVEKVELEVIESAIEGEGPDVTGKNSMAVDLPGKDTSTPGDVISSKAIDSRITKTIRVDIKRLDTLLNLVGELIIQKTRMEDVFNDKDHVKDEHFKHLERIISSLHDAVMKIRMVPIEIVFNRFPRMVRDLSKNLGKEIELLMSGEDTELDRTVVDEIGEPLVHLIRNSIDHGIEIPQKRISMGKPRQGHISLKAYQDGNSVAIEVEDDGQGINLEKVKEKAVEMGVIIREELNSLTEKQLLELLFLPSMSTTDTVSDLSGRGVGLDAVKAKIESLGGVVEINTRAGSGARFIIRLPLTLAMIQALLVCVGEERYAIPLSNVKQIVKVKPGEIKEVQKKEILLMGETMVPVIRLVRVLGISHGNSKPDETGSVTIVIVNKGEKLYGFVVDELLGQQEIVIKNAGKYLAGVKTISGATILGDGKVALILDLNYLMQ
ncbi:MAG: chemotaxis protein CheA [Clostridiaceae bacterium]|nr:chemotaxis protein CheA [Clostridiaceae bacterium]